MLNIERYIDENRDIELARSADDVSQKNDPKALQEVFFATSTSAGVPSQFLAQRYVTAVARIM